MRTLKFLIVQVYIPSMLIVILSFVSFWIDHKSVRLRRTESNINISHHYIQVPARISVGLLTVLTVTTQSSGNKKLSCILKKTKVNHLFIPFHFMFTASFLHFSFNVLSADFMILASKGMCIFVKNIIFLAMNLAYCF